MDTPAKNDKALAKDEPVAIPIEPSEDATIKENEQPVGSSDSKVLNEPPKKLPILEPEAELERGEKQPTEKDWDSDEEPERPDQHPRGRIKPPVSGGSSRPRPPR